MEFWIKYNEYLKLINDTLANYVNERVLPGTTIYKAMWYSLSAGGKRIRPVLALAVCELLDGDYAEVMPYACAIEMIHTYSLIHDDLPAMDNDDMRRGRPTNHKVFGEAAAVLAGDALLNRAFEIILSFCGESETDMKKIKARIASASILAEAAGANGMIGGQIVDIESENKKIPYEQLLMMHNMKTGALLRAPVLIAAKLNHADEDRIGALRVYSEKLGLAFQIKDDIMNETGDPEKMGKASGSDKKKGKSTFVSILGLEKAKDMLFETIDAATGALGIFGEKAAFLTELAMYVRDRSS